MILDCFPFFNEMDILEGRLEYLYDSVDYFVIIESDVTFSGISKPLNYLQNIKRYQRYTDKIFYFPLFVDRNQFDFSKSEDHWKVEYLQRNHITSALKAFPDDAIAFITDLDEIINKDTIKLAETYLNDGSMGDILSLEQKIFYYNFSTHAPYKQKEAIVAKNKYIREHGTQKLRSNCNNYNYIIDGGWHLTYWGGAEKISEKIKSFSHQEFNTEEFTNLDRIQERVSGGKDLFGRSYYGDMIQTDMSTLPRDLLQAFEKYSV